MYCPNCDMRVETEVVRGADPEHYVRDVGEMGKALGHGWFDADDIEPATGTEGRAHCVEDIENRYKMDTDGHPQEGYCVKLRVDICANCAVPIDARLYTVLA